MPPPLPARRPSRVTQLTLLRGDAPDAASEARWIERLRAGEDAARDWLYRRYALDLWRLLWRLLGADQELDDLHHEVFVHALASLATFRGEAPLWAWLRGVAVRRTQQLLRRRRRRWWLRLLGPDEVAAEPAVEPASANAALAQQVREVLAEMAPEERLLFMLRFVEQLTIAELATACQASAGTVKRRLQQARRHFEQRARRQPEVMAWLDERGRQSGTEARA